MTPKEAFKLGFMSKCADAGLTPEETHQKAREAIAMIKAAEGLLSLPSTVLKGLLFPLLAVPPIAGITGGYALSKLQDNAFDLSEAKKREEIAEYERALQRLRTVAKRQGLGAPTAV